jgi:hypothetical protein
MIKSFLGLVKLTDYTSLEKIKTSLESEKTTLQSENSRLIRQLGNAELNLRTELEQKEKTFQKVNETLVLAESCLKEKEELEERYKLVRKLLETAVKDGYRLSNLEKNLLLEYLPPICDIPPEKKIKYGSEHHFPRGTDTFLLKVASCPYVSEVKRGVTNRTAVKNTQLKKVNENGTYDLRAVYVHKGGVEVEIITTAKDSMQLDFVYRLIREELKINNH